MFLPRSIKATPPWGWRFLCHDPPPTSLPPAPPAPLSTRWGTLFYTIFFRPITENAMLSSQFSLFPSVERTLCCPLGVSPSLFFSLVPRGAPTALFFTEPEFSPDREGVSLLPTQPGSLILSSLVVAHIHSSDGQIKGCLLFS